MLEGRLGKERYNTSEDDGSVASRTRDSLVDGGANTETRERRDTVKFVVNGVQVGGK